MTTKKQDTEELVQSHAADVDTKTLALRQTILRAIADALKAEMDAGRADLTERLVELYDALGSKSFDVKLESGKKVATLSLSISQPAPKVTDEKAVLEWAKRNAPDLVRVVPAREEVATAGLLERLSFAEDGTAYDRNGEVVPGVTMTAGGEVTHYSTKFVPDGRRAIAEAWSRGEFARTLPGVAPALADGGDDGDE